MDSRCDRRLGPPTVARMAPWRIRRGATRGSKVHWRMSGVALDEQLPGFSRHIAPTRAGAPTSWQTFLRAHWGAIAGADFFTTEVRMWGGLLTYYTGVVRTLFILRRCEYVIAHVAASNEGSSRT